MKKKEIWLNEQHKNEVLAMWREMTENNEHTLVRRTIAGFFGRAFDHHYDLFNAMYKRNEERGYQSQEDLELSCEATHCMLYRIADIYGKRVAKQVNDCL